MDPTFLAALAHRKRSTSWALRWPCVAPTPAHSARRLPRCRCRSRTAPGLCEVRAAAARHYCGSLRSFVLLRPVCFEETHCFLASSLLGIFLFNFDQVGPARRARL